MVKEHIATIAKLRTLFFWKVFPILGGFEICFDFLVLCIVGELAGALSVTVNYEQLMTQHFLRSYSYDLFP